MVDDGGFPGRCARLRNMAGISQRKASRLAGLSESTVRHQETMFVSSPSNETLIGLATLFDVTTDYLLTGRGEPPTEDHIKAAVARAEEELALREGAA